MGVMKIFTILSSIALATVLLFTGCATTVPIDNTQAAVRVIQDTVPFAVAYAVSQDTNSIPYFKIAVITLNNAVATTNVSPAALIQALNSTSIKELKNPLTQAAIFGGIAIYQGYFEPAVTANTNNVVIVQAVANAIQAGLPPGGKKLQHRRYTVTRTYIKVEDDKQATINLKR